MTEKANTSTHGRATCDLHEFGDCFGEDFCVLVYVGGGGVWAHEGHVVEWS